MCVLCMCFRYIVVSQASKQTRRGQKRDRRESQGPTSNSNL